MQDPTETAGRRGHLARLSIEHKLPLLFGGVLIVVILSLSASAVLEMRRAALHAASERSSSLSKQVAGMLAQQGPMIRALATATASKPELRLFATSPTAAARTAALQALESSGSQRDQIIRSELRDAGDVILLTNETDTVGAALAGHGERRAIPANDSVGVGPFIKQGANAQYYVAAPVPGLPGYRVVQWRRLTVSRAAREQFQQLIGSEATLYVGNTDETYLTNLETNVTSVHVNREALVTPQVESRSADNGESRHLVSWASVARTPWIVGVDFPLDVILAPVNAFVRRIAMLASLALIVGLFAAWLMSRRITGPLSELSAAADAVSHGDYSRTLAINRSDELGRLGTVFNSMSAEVAQSRHGLELMVQERTRALHDTLQQLHDTQQSLVRRERLAMLGQLAGGVGHELRNPLGVMTNAVYYLKMVLAPARTDVGEYLEILQQQIALSEKIVSDLLDFARQKPPVRLPASLADITRAQIERLGSTNGVAISTEIPETLPPVMVDRTQVGQIMLNLLTNAMQAMEHRGRITIRAHAERSSVHLDVEDTGPGISPQNADKIFEPLFTTKARGIGLGLAVSRTLARANEGDLTLRNTVGTGADFRLTLPIADAEVRA